MLEKKDVIWNQIHSKVLKIANQIEVCRGIFDPLKIFSGVRNFQTHLLLDKNLKVSKRDHP